MENLATCTFEEWAVNADCAEVDMPTAHHNILADPTCYHAHWARYLPNSVYQFSRYERWDDYSDSDYDDYNYTY